MDLPESIAATLRVVHLLEDLGVPYAIGGSLASSVHGVLRASFDADIVADLRLTHVPPLCRALEGDFYLDEGRIRDAIVSSASFNLIELRSMFKIDVFVAGGKRFEKTQLERAVTQTIWPDPLIEARVSSKEDTVLAKLDWFRRGGEVSERQWADVLGIMRVQTGRLDREYLQRSATEMALSDLLSRAFFEADARGSSV